MTYTTIDYTVTDRVLTLTLNRPERLNAFTVTMADELEHAFRRASADDHVGAIVVTGAGRAFCAGMDLAATGNVFGLDETQHPTLADMHDRLEDPAILRGVRDTGGRVVLAIYECMKPVIGAINGAAVTGGFELALACDVLVASPLARFADTHARVGIAPGWGLSQKLSRAIGIYRAREISLTGNWVSAEQAAAWGFVNRVVPAEGLLDAARALAHDMLSCVPEMLVRYKSIIDDGFALPFGEGMALEKARSTEFNATVGAAAVEARREAVRARNRGG